MKTKSIWGAPPKRLYKLIKLAEENLEPNFKSCIVGCSDGKFLMPFARKKHFITGYDIDDIALFGGEKEFPIIEKKISHKYNKEFVSSDFNLETKRVVGLCERIEIEKLNKYTNIKKCDFYKNVPNEQYDVVFTSCSLHYSVNKDFTLEEKTKMLQNITKNNGYLYIDYMMAIDEKDYVNYPKNKFYRKGEIAKYFGPEWEILSYKENNNPSFEGAHVDCVKDHFHRFGYILAKKKQCEKEICWNITTRCNQHCKYCHRFLNLMDLSLEQNQKILKNLIRDNITAITWTGGEALLFDGIDELLKESCEAGIKNKLITNGKLLTKERIERISKYLDSITLSIDSVDNNINEKLGRGYNHYNNIKDILDFLNTSNIKIRINSVICNYNKDSIDELIKFLNNYNIYSWRLFKFMPLREQAIMNKNEFNISLNKYKSIVKNVKTNSNIENIDSRIEKDMEQKYILILADGSIVITENGIDSKKGNALKNSVQEFVTL